MFSIDLLANTAQKFLYNLLPWVLSIQRIFNSSSTKFCEDQGTVEITLLPSLDIVAPICFFPPVHVFYISLFLIDEQLKSGELRLRWDKF
jgi:hypothetical protein